MTPAEVVAWQLSGQLTDAMLAAGAPALLVLAMLFRSAGIVDLAGAVRYMERRALLGIALVSLAWIPWYPAAVGDRQLAMPPAWYLLLRLAAATNEALVAGLPARSELSARVMALAGADLEAQPELQAEYGDFESSCYLPARRKAAEMGLDESEASWSGAEALVQTPGFYRRCGAEPGPACEQGFLAPEQGAATDAAESPSCRQWWLGSGGRDGLRDRLVQGLRQDVEPVWAGDLSEGDKDAWLQSYLLRSGASIAGMVGKGLGAVTGLGRLWDWTKDLVGGATDRLIPAVGGTVLAWKIGSGGLLLLYLMPDALAQLQVFLLSLIALLWPAIALLSGLSLRTLLGTARFWLLISLWTSFTAVGEVLHQLLWYQVAGEDHDFSTLATNLGDPGQLLLWYLAASLPWLTPLVSTWILWALTDLPRR